MIRVFVGTAANGEDAESQAVLEYTLRKYASEPVEIVWMMLSRDPKSFWSGWNSESWHTPFSALRWGIPAFCNFKGRAIYCDSDMIFRADIAELWNQPIPAGAFALTRDAGGKIKTCVMLMDCERARFILPPLGVIKADPNAHKTVTKMLQARPHLVGKFDGQWNCIDLKRATGIDDPTIKNIHYSSMPNQPHLPMAMARLARTGRSHWYDGPTGPHWRPELIALFEQELAAAIAAGYTPEKYDHGETYGPYRKRSQRDRKVKTG